LCELLAAIIEAAEVGLGLFVNDSVSTNITTLGESLVANIALVRALSSVSSFVGL
jgi:hypothetical protein